MIKASHSLSLRSHESLIRRACSTRYEIIRGKIPHMCGCSRVCMSLGLIRRTFRDTALTNRHPDTTFSSSEHTGCGFPGS